MKDTVCIHPQTCDINVPAEMEGRLAIEDTQKGTKKRLTWREFAGRLSSQWINIVHTTSRPLVGRPSILIHVNQFH